MITLKRVYVPMTSTDGVRQFMAALAKEHATVKRESTDPLAEQTTLKSQPTLKLPQQRGFSVWRESIRSPMSTSACEATP